MNVNESAILRTVPAAGNLHKVPGFDPLKHLQRVIDSSGNAVLQLGLPYKRLWFRLAYPSGRLLLNPLRITDQMAIFEAQVFFQREDATPASSFTSTKTAQEARAYIRAAQDEALNVALDNAGFGIQLCDVTQGTDSGKADGEAPRPKSSTVAQTQPQQKIEEAVAAVPPKKQPAPAAKTTESAPPAQPVQTAADVPPSDQPVRQATETAVSAAAQPLEREDAAAPMTQPAQADLELTAPVPAEGQIVEATLHQETESQAVQENSAVTILKFPAQPEESEVEPAPVEEGLPAGTEAAETAPAYTEDMSVEDIAARMTMAEAQEVVVGTGLCRGWTLGQVLECRPASLKYFITPFYEASNIFKAAATLMYQEANQQMAG